MKTKVTFIIVIIFFLQFISSCCRGVKYFDFTEMDSQLSGTIVKQGENLTIALSASDLKYVSFNYADFGFASSLAFDCDDGWGGMKYSFDKIEITSSADFNSEFLANENLNSLFLIKKFMGNDGFELSKINEVELTEFSSNYLELVLNERPTVDMGHQFNIKLTKSNEGEIIVGTEEVTWE